MTDATTGERYCIGYISKPTKTNYDMLNPFWYINKQWLDTLGLEVPTTVDELHDVLTHFLNDDPNGNGEKDEIPFFTMDGGYRTKGLQQIINAYIYCQDEYVYNVENGKVYVPYDQDEYRQALITLNQWYKEGLISPLCFTTTKYAETKTLFNVEDEKTAILGNILCNPTLYVDNENDVRLQYVGVDLLEAETPRGGYNNTYGVSYGYMTYITCDAEDPELCFRFMDFFNDFETFMFNRYGRKDIDWEYCEEGLVNSVGETARVNLIDSTVYTTQNNINWHYLGGGIQEGYLALQPWVDDGSEGTAWKKARSEYTVQVSSHDRPAEYIQQLSYSADEQEIVTENLTLFKDRVKEARSQFVTGVLDPNNDKDWNDYVASLENLGMSKLIECAQGAYDRMSK